MNMKYIKSFDEILIETIHSDFRNETYYHGNRKGDFPPKRRRFSGAIFLTNNLNFAKNFAGFDERDLFPNGAVWEVKLIDNLKICDPMNPMVMKELNLKNIIQQMIDDKYVDEANGKKFLDNRGKGFKGYDYETGKEFDLNDTSESVYNYLWLIKNGAWQIIECDPITQAIKDNGYHGFQVVERGVKNLAIFDEKFIKYFKKLDL